MDESDALLLKLDHSFSALRARLDDVARTQQVYADCLAPLISTVASAAQQGTLTQLQQQLQQCSERLEQEQSQWDRIDAPAIKAARAAAESDLSLVQQQSSDLQRSLADLSSMVNQLNELESQHPARPPSDSSTPSPLPFTLLPERPLCAIVSFLRPLDLAHLLQLSPSSVLLFDRGLLWRGLCVRTVEQIVTVQRAAQQAASAKRRALGGLPDDFQSNNFLVCATAPSSDSGSSTNPLSPSAASAASPPPPPPTHCQVQISFTQASSARTKGSTGSSLPKAELFAAALRSLQRTVAPALSEFEDQSLKQSAHQRTIGFLHAQRDEVRARLTEALGQQSDEFAALQKGTKLKDALAADIARLEGELLEQKRLVAAQASQTAALERAQTKQANLRRHMDALVSESLPTEELAAAAAERAREEAEAEQAAKQQAAQAEEIAAGILVLKQQKKVLTKAAKAMAAELEQTKHERAEFEAKLHQLRVQLQTVQV